MRTLLVVPYRIHARPTLLPVLPTRSGRARARPCPRSCRHSTCLKWPVLPSVAAPPLGDPTALAASTILVPCLALSGGVHSLAGPAALVPCLAWRRRAQRGSSPPSNIPCWSWQRRSSPNVLLSRPASRLRAFCGLTFRAPDGLTPLDGQEPSWSAELSKFGIAYLDADGASQFFVDYW